MAVFTKADKSADIEKVENGFIVRTSDFSEKEVRPYNKNESPYPKLLRNEENKVHVFATLQEALAELADFFGDSE